MVKEYKCSELAELVNGKASSNNIIIDNISSLESANDSSISFLSDASYIPKLSDTKSKVILIKQDDLKYWDKDYIVVKNPYLAFSKIATLFDSQNEQTNQGIHSSVVIGKDAKIGQNAYIAANTVIGEGCLLGKNIQIGPNVSIGHDVAIGNNTIIHANVSIENKVKIGNNCVLFSGSRIGTDGFGYAPDSDGSWSKIPQTGSVVIEDNVDIGANTTIDCGAIDDTTIKTGVKIDNLVHIAHNCIIGEGTIIAAMAGFAGSSKIGKHCMIGGGARIGPNISIADKTVISPTTPIARSIKKEGQRFTGAVPPLNHKDWLKFAVKFMLKKGMK